MSLAADPAPAPAEPPLSEVLAGLPEEGPLTLGGALDAMGSRAHGCALLLLAIPDAIPLPVPSLSLILGLPLLAVSAHLAVTGEHGLLPRRLRARTLPPGLVTALRGRVAALLRRAERMSRVRLRQVAGRARLLGLVCLWLSALLLLPLPFFNTPPAVCLVLLAWGMVQRDGVFVVAGLAGTAGVTLALWWIADSLWRLAGEVVPALG